NLDDGLGSTRDVEGPQDRTDMILDRRIGEIERTTDRFVAFALHHQREHGHLPLSQAGVGRRFQRWILGAGAPHGSRSYLGLGPNSSPGIYLWVISRRQTLCSLGDDRSLRNTTHGGRDDAGDW